MKNLGNMLKEAQKLQSRMAEMQQKLAETEMSGAAGGGMVTVTLNGKGEMRKIKIDPSLAVADEIEILEDLIVAACNDAKAKIEALHAGGDGQAHRRPAAAARDSSCPSDGRRSRSSGWSGCWRACPGSASARHSARRWPCSSAATR